MLKIEKAINKKKTKTIIKMKNYGKSSSYVFFVCGSSQMTRHVFKSKIKRKVFGYLGFSIMFNNNNNNTIKFKYIFNQSKISEL